MTKLEVFEAIFGVKSSEIGIDFWKEECDIEEIQGNLLGLRVADSKEKGKKTGAKKK